MSPSSPPQCKTPSDYYQNAPCNYYAAFWHSVAVNGLQYGFAYDDDNGQSSDFNSTDAQYVQVAISFEQPAAGARAAGGR